MGQPGGTENVVHVLTGRKTLGCFGGLSFGDWLHASGNSGGRLQE